jgi:hypothetical protein
VQENEPHYFSDQQLIVLLFDLWVAGQVTKFFGSFITFQLKETTSNTLQCFLAHLIHNPEVEKKAHEELDRVIKSDRMITVADKNDLPYISAIVNVNFTLKMLTFKNCRRPKEWLTFFQLISFIAPQKTFILASIC